MNYQPAPTALFRRRLPATLVLGLALGACSLLGAEDFSSDAAKLLDRYCVTCHNERLMTGGLALDSLDLQQVGAHAEVLEKVVSKLRARDMPPVGRPRPSDDQYDATVGELESALDLSLIHI